MAHHHHEHSNAQSQVRNGIFRSERREDPMVTSFKELLGVVQRIYDLTGQLDLKRVIDNAQKQLGRVPSDLS